MFLIFQHFSISQPDPQNVNFMPILPTAPPCKTPPICNNAQIFDDFLCDCVCLTKLQCPGETQLDPIDCTCQCPHVFECDVGETYDSFFCACVPTLNPDQQPTPDTQTPVHLPDPKSFPRPYPQPYPGSFPYPYYPQPIRYYPRPYLSPRSHLPLTPDLPPQPDPYPYPPRTQLPDLPNPPLIQPPITRCPLSAFRQQCSRYQYFDYTTCQCICRQPSRYQCTHALQQFNPNTCQCECVNVLVLENFGFSQRIPFNQDKDIRVPRKGGSGSSKRRRRESKLEEDLVLEARRKRRSGSDSSGSRQNEKFHDFPSDRFTRVIQRPAPCPIGLNLNVKTCECYY